MSAKNYDFNPELDLMLERTVSITPSQMFKGWTTPELLMKWFCPLPWTVSACEIDLKPGGKFNTTFRSPEGEAHSNVGSYLEIIENKKIVWTDALSEGFRPTEKSFITATVTFEEHPQGTLYRAIVKHKNVADKESHAAMGFEAGWGMALDQLVKLMKG